MLNVQFCLHSFTWLKVLCLFGHWQLAPSPSVLFSLQEGEESQPCIQLLLAVLPEDVRNYKHAMVTTPKSLLQEIYYVNPTFWNTGHA